MDEILISFCQEPTSPVQLIDDELICAETGKLCYTTKTQAKKHRKMMQFKYHCKYRIYQCEHCNLFHYTTKEMNQFWSKNG
jgi:hypothetical protein